MLVVQLLDDPEFMDDKTLLLLLCKRNVENRIYEEKMEINVKWGAEEAKHPDLETLKKQCREIFGLQASEHIELTKYVPHEFQYKHIDGKK